jgi:hypothetical protein
MNDRGKGALGGLLASHPGLDWIFIFGPLALALGLGAMASLSPAMLIAVVLVDVWLFANPHLVATYTRIGARAADLRRHWFLVFLLPAIVLAGVLATALAYEVAGLFTLYFVAQTYHVARQSFGIARGYRRRASGALRPDRLSEILVHLFPAWGLLARCAEAPQAFLGYPISLPAVPVQLADGIGFVALACGAWWLQRQCRAALKGNIDWRHDVFVVSHLCVSFIAYVWTTDITTGWLVVNIWHNLQYLLFVWAQNLRRDAQAQSAHASHIDIDIDIDIANLSHNAARYGGICLATGAALYLTADWAGTQLIWLGLPTVLIAHFTLNFHHYLVDGVIWKQRRSSWLRPKPSEPGAPGPHMR